MYNSKSTYQHQVYNEKNPGQHVCTIYATFPCKIIDIRQKNENENENVKYVTAALELSFGTGLADVIGVAK